tara:strand:- start:921 stop:2783 length:1863 start_codon:yes stop_codon:yes gene_type:complete
MASNKLAVSDLDFDNIKSNLKTFLQNQPEFSDYNFEGSGFAVLLDLLAYNTHYLGFNANMLANEMYLDSADIRKNIVSIAKMLGYTPTSAKSPVADISITVNNVPTSTASITMAKGTAFETTVDDVTYQYLTNAEITITPSDGVYTFSNVDIFEGTLVSFRYTVDSSDPDQRFIIPSELADMTTLKVQVQNSSTDSTTNTFTKTTGLTSINSTSKVYFLQESEDERYEIYFGDGVLGKKLDDGNIVICEYIVTNKEASNGASSFTLSGNIGGFTDVSITTNSSSQGGSDPQTKESIRFNAPLQYSRQDRAVTTGDYETLVTELYPNAQAVSAWGGEDDENPVYGQVKIAIKAASGSTLTNQTKTDLVAQLKKYNVASVTPVIVDPETTDIILTTTAKFDEKATTKNADTIKSNIITSLDNYNTDTLQKFDSVFRHSKVVKQIDDTDTSILSNVTTIKVRKSFTPTLSSSTRYDVYFRNGIFNPHSGHKSSMGGVITSSGFKVDGDTTNIYYLDDDGEGNIRRYYFVGTVRTYANNTQGTVDYSTGQITINSLNVSSIENIRGASSTVIEITVEPASNDIVPVRDQILNIDTANSTITVEADTFVGGSASAGVGYTTTSSY